MDYAFQDINDIPGELPAVRTKPWGTGQAVFYCLPISIEMLQLLLRLGTFQLSDIFCNTVGGVLGGLLYYVVMKARKRL